MQLKALVNRTVKPLTLILSPGGERRPEAVRAAPLSPPGERVRVRGILEMPKAFNCTL